MSDLAPDAALQARPAAVPETAAPKAGRSDLGTRIATALVAAPIGIGAAWLGGLPFALLALVLAAAAQLEVYRLAEARGVGAQIALGLILGALVVLRPFVPFVEPLLVGGALLVLLAALFSRTEQPLLETASTLMGVVYPAALLGYLVVIREASEVALGAPEAFWLTLAVLLVTWATDTFAYAVGRLLGRTKLFPRVSPNKTWEGSAGGALGAIAVALALKALVLPSLSWADAAVLGLIGGAASQLGDLVESRFKRAACVKDSGRFFPGHGGALDRFDALVVTAPLAYLYLHWGAGLI